ncbi:MAG: hypothetical protein JWO67_2681 [Streptosporangiaceae bacterium]|nr:hypothetical protein [Streptosporangiaceae bacterium]
MSKAETLAQAAREASEVRGYATDPDVVALRIERIRAWCDRLVWTGIVAGLLFTMANVQHFASGTAKPPWEHGGSIDWVIAWLLDPMVSLVLIGVLMGEQVINRHGIKAGGWVRVTKWVALGCTYSMNTWSAWDLKDPAQILLHSVPPVIVVCATEAIPTLRRQITEAVKKAYRAAVTEADQAANLPLAPAVVAPETVADEYDTSDWPDTPESLEGWLPVPEVQRVPEPQVHVPDDSEPSTQPVPDQQHVAAVALFGDEVREGRVPGIQRIRKALGIGQDRAYAVQAYLKTIATE